MHAYSPGVAVACPPLLHPPTAGAAATATAAGATVYRQFDD